MKPRSSSTLELFYPPTPSYAFIGFLQRIAPFVLRIGWDLETVCLSPEDLIRLRQLGNQSAIIVSNHPSLAEPGVIFHTLGLAGISAHSLSAWDTMALYGRIWQRFLQLIGCYSIMRARRDRASMMMTQQLLADGQRIVIFPEGQTYGLNDTLLPFQQGVIQMGFWALEQMDKQGIDRPLYIVPLAIKYIYTEPMDGTIEASLMRLEDALQIRGPFVNRYQRLRAVASAVMEKIEEEMTVECSPDRPLDSRIQCVREAMINRLSEELKIELPREANLQLKLQLLGNALDEISYPFHAEESEEKRQEREGLMDRLPGLQPLWLRLKNFQAVHDGYVAENPSPERFADVLGRLEYEVFGKVKLRGRRKAMVSAADFIDLRNHLAAYHQGKRETVSTLTDQLQATVARMLFE